MAIFGKQVMSEEKAQRVLSKFGLENIDPQYAEAVQEIAQELVGTGMMEFGLKLGSGSQRDILKQQTYYQGAILKQNFIMIRQLDQIAYMLEQMTRR